MRFRLWRFILPSLLLLLPSFALAQVAPSSFSEADWTGNISVAAVCPVAGGSAFFTYQPSGVSTYSNICHTGSWTGVVQNIITTDMLFGTYHIIIFNDNGASATGVYAADLSAAGFVASYDFTYCSAGGGCMAPPVADLSAYGVWGTIATSSQNLIAASGVSLFEVYSGTLMAVALIFAFLVGTAILLKKLLKVRKHWF